MQLIKKINRAHNSCILKSSITVPDMCKSITIRKKTESSIDNFFKNKIDITFFDSTRKWYERFDRYKDHLVIEDDRDVIGAISSGKWEVYFEVFQVYEDVDITLDITFELYEDYNTYTGELHTHTNNTDGVLSFEELSEALKDNGYDFFFISDHNSITAWHDLKSLNGIKGYRSLELTTFSGHILLPGIDGYISWYRDDGTPKEMKEIRQEVQSKGGLMGIAHPFATGGPFCAGCRWKRSIEPEYLDFIEIWNSKIENYKDNWEAIDLWVDILRKDIRVFGTCGADIHRFKDLKAALKIKALSVRNDEDSIKDALRKGRFYISKDTELALDINGKTFGQTVMLDAKESESDEVIIKYNIDQFDEAQQLFVISKDGLRALENTESEFKQIIKNEKDFIMLMGMSPDKNLKFITNPVFIEKS
jgi:hypothetical protein